VRPISSVGTLLSRHNVVIMYLLYVASGCRES